MLSSFYLSKDDQTFTHTNSKSEVGEVITNLGGQTQLICCWRSFHFKFYSTSLLGKATNIFVLIVHECKTKKWDVFFDSEALFCFRPAEKDLNLIPAHLFAHTINLLALAPPCIYIETPTTAYSLGQTGQHMKCTNLSVSKSHFL